MTTPEPSTGRELQEEIEQTRERLGQTVEELVAKADVKARAQAKAAEVKVKAQDKAADVKSRAVGMSGNVRQSQLVQRQLVQGRWPLVAVVAGAILIGSSIVVRRRQQR
jgi:succinyl-CoA synthetase beta subunit